MQTSATNPSNPSAVATDGNVGSKTRTADGHRGPLDPIDAFEPRHIGPSAGETSAMLATLGFDSLDELSDACVPQDIRRDGLDLPPARTQSEVLDAMGQIASLNKTHRSFIGMGYHGTIVPPVVLRNVLENPAWYTQYTPYQAEIAQGRLEALLNFQTMISDLTGLPLAGASLLDEPTAAAEAVSMAAGLVPGKRSTVFVADDCHPQTIDVVRARAEAAGLSVVVGPIDDFDAADHCVADSDQCDVFAVMWQCPATDGRFRCNRSIAERVHDCGALVIAAADPLSLMLVQSPGSWGADICVGSAQRFGVPMGLGGPHAAFLSTREKYARKMPGRIIGVSKDAAGRPALRMAMQTREQHIRRDKATSNICTAQALLAVMASMYAVHHGPQGLHRIATRVRDLTITLMVGLERLGHVRIGEGPIFDTVRIGLGRGRQNAARQIADAARERGVNVREYDDGTLGVTLDETADVAALADLWAAFNFGHFTGFDADEILAAAQDDDRLSIDSIRREDEVLTHPVFHRHQSETGTLRYIFQLMERDLSLVHSMMPLGSCTMKLNATAEMLPISMPGFANIHPFAPDTQWRGYTQMFRTLESWLADITELPAVSLQPNAGAQGEYAGLLVIAAHHRRRHADGDDAMPRDVCLIPTSAHGTNPASAVMSGMRVVAIGCDADGNIDIDDLAAKAEQHRERLAALMVTYPSTHGVFESTIRKVCDIVHDNGGLVYMDGANMNAQVGVTSPGRCGADVCHLNLHKTFCIPHGGGGPGMGPIAVTETLSEYLPGHPNSRPDTAGEYAIGPISGAPYGSASILTISYAYIAMMGAGGLRRATQVALLNANYMAGRLRDHYDILFADANGRVAHEFIIDCRPLKTSAGIEIDDIAKRLMDYGFHAPTMSWPVPGTLMIEPTESESQEEMDRFCDAMISIRQEIRGIESGDFDAADNPLKRSPHPIGDVVSDSWDRPYSRETAAFPVDRLRARKFWPTVSRIDNTHGDRHLICTCPTVEEMAEDL